MTCPRRLYYANGAVSRSSEGSCCVLFCRHSHYCSNSTIWKKVPAASPVGLRFQMTCNTLQGDYIPVLYFPVTGGLTLKRFFIISGMERSHLWKHDSNIESIMRIHKRDIHGPGEQKTLNKCWFNVGPPSTTLEQHWFNVLCLLGTVSILANTKHLYNICTTSAQRLRRWSNIVQMLYKCLWLMGWWRRTGPAVPSPDHAVLRDVCGDPTIKLLAGYMNKWNTWTNQVMLG